MESNEFLLEEKKLKSSLIEIQKVLEMAEDNLKSLTRSRNYDAVTLATLLRMGELRVENLKKSEQRPYFARIDFKESGEKEYNNIYIGKVGVFDTKSKILITDWRAPVASIYYDSNIGEAEYLAPDGIIKGDLSLKRQIIIEEGKLQSIFDVDSVSDDELLKPYLGVNADSRLKNIVASIQKEQNDIIREILYKNVIVQGVAGSGKTTVALHRIAYLIYNYSKKFTPNQFMVIGPNNFFIKYISNVLPDLDVGNAYQSTFTELAKEFIGEKFEVSDLTFNLTQAVNKKETLEFLKYKLSLAYKKDIDKYLTVLEKSLIPDNGLVVNDFTVLTKKQILELYNSLNYDISIAEKFSIMISKIKSIIENDRTIYLKISEHYTKITNNLNEEEKKKMFIEEWDTKTQLKTQFSSALKKIFNVKTKKVTVLYKDFISNVAKYVDNVDNVDNVDLAEKISKETLKKVSKKIFDFEDIAALMYIKLMLHGQREYKEFVHAVIDEAQDFGEFNFFVLKKLLSNSTFSIFGDLTQGIYSYRAISNWEQVKKYVFEDKCEILKLEKSYRTTIEIMLAANLVSKHLNLGEGQPVIRHGEDVKLVKSLDVKKADYILNQIDNAKKDGMKSIAIICKTLDECIHIDNALKAKKIEIELITEDNETYNGGTCILTSYLSKGLEFDCVFVYNVDESSYDSSSDLEMKLLYVAMTRALHRLELLYTKAPTFPLMELLEEKK
jgi:DNA helicase-2/ATP-dependent DNA helicase PcrA